jgi:hypothetical protein
MSERWQQWMPFHIDRFRGSPDVQAMHPIAKLGYIMLLASSWQTPDCAVANDPVELSIASSLGDALWGEYRTRILRKFVDHDGRLRNEVLFKEWSEAKRIYESRSASAKRTNQVRSPSRSPLSQYAVTDHTPSRPADTITGTLTKGASTSPRYDFGLEESVTDV